MEPCGDAHRSGRDFFLIAQGAFAALAGTRLVIHLAASALPMLAIAAMRPAFGFPDGMRPLADSVFSVMLCIDQCCSSKPANCSRSRRELVP